jgi:hypothetical protein
MIRRLFTMTILGRIGLRKLRILIKTNCVGAKITPPGPKGAHPIKSLESRQLTQAGAHSVPGTQTQPKLESKTHDP